MGDSYSDNSAAWSAAAQTVSTAGNILAQSNINRRTQAWNEKMYDLQRGHALQDWNMQNAYNTPAAQMGRYRDAGLNPNLIYGQSNEAGVVRSTDAKSWNPQAPDMSGFGTVMDKYFNTQMKEAQINNARAINDNLLADNVIKGKQAELIDKQIQNYDSTIGFRDWDLTNRQSLAPGNKEMQDWRIRHTMKDLDIKGQIHEMNLLQRSQNLEKGAAEIIRIRTDTALKNLDMAYRQGQINKLTYDTEMTKTKLLSEVIHQSVMEEMKRKIGVDIKSAESANDRGAVQTALNAVNTIFGMYRFPK